MSTTLVEPQAGFDAFNLCPELKRAIKDAGFKSPRPIQAQTIPLGLAGKDVLGLAQTGTGKTAAFALPVLERMLKKKGGGPRVLVLAPTRELALQIDSDFRMLARHTNVRTVTIYGGVSDRPQIRALKQRPEVVVACPGRLLDLMGQGQVRFKELETLILDEADQMFDMGFLPDIRRIIKALPAERQNLLFAATMPKEIRGLADEILVDPAVVELEHSKPAETIEHSLYPVHEKQKIKLLDHFLSQRDFVSAIVFTRTKYRAKRLAERLDRSGHRAVCLQGNMSQGQRDRAMNGFRDGRYDVLVATDIVSRGIDVAHVSHVINYDVPGTPDAYTHRIGRTGRAERSGKAYTFVTADDREIIRAIERKIGTTIPRQTVAGFDKVDLNSTSDLEAGRPARRPARTGSRSGFGGGPRGGPRTGSKRGGPAGGRSAGAKKRAKRRAGGDKVGEQIRKNKPPRGRSKRRQRSRNAS